MRLPSFGVVDYGVGNYSSLRQSIKNIGFLATVSSELEVLNSMDILLLPGVGTFPAAMSFIKQRDLNDFLREQQAHKPIIGICLGMELLFQNSTEKQGAEGLGLIPGQVIPLNNKRYHIGWNSLKPIKRDPITNSITGKEFYFNHSYIVDTDDKYKLATIEGPQEFPTIVRSGNLIGLQFHPEKSQEAGKRFLEHLVHQLF